MSKMLDSDTTINNMEKLLNKDIRVNAFKKSIRFINYELVEGDIVEFGVYTGRSLAMLSYCNNEYYKNENSVNSKNNLKRQIYGFDSFEGLPETDGHLRWEENMFKYNHSYHPTIDIGVLVTPKIVEDFFFKMNLNKPIIKKNYYNELNIDDIDSIALCHIDCDLYSSTKDALNLIKKKLVNGSIIMFDDWFNNKANPNTGEQKAYNEFLEENKNIHSQVFDIYGTFCKAFVINIDK
jgi:hypothetical protein